MTYRAMLLGLLLVLYVPMPQTQMPVLPGMASPQERIQNMGNPWPRGTVGNPVYAVPEPPPGMGQCIGCPVQPIRPMQPWGR